MGPQTLIFAIVREISPPRPTDISTAITNFIVTIGAAIFQSQIGYLVVLYWPGAQTLAGVPFYTVQKLSVHAFCFAGVVIHRFSYDVRRAKNRLSEIVRPTPPDELIMTRSFYNNLIN